MSSSFRLQFEEPLIGFAWEEWAQMGILATAGPPRRWAQDPEALLLFTLEVARADPRLFDEVLDWLATNEELVNLRRLRSLAVDPEDKTLSEAAIAWLSQQRPKARFGTPRFPPSGGAPESLFFDEGFPVPHNDESFADHGWLRPPVVLRHTSRRPDLRAPVNFSFRLRHFFGLTTRAEVARLLYTLRDTAASVATLARSAGYTKRNVHEALASLEQAGVIGGLQAGNELRYRMDQQRWSSFLAVSQPIEHVDWPPILLSLRRIVRWMRQADEAERSEYLLSSSARDLVERIRPDLEESGIELLNRDRLIAASAIDDLMATINAIFERLEVA